jgi:hypothetical protein
MNALQRPVLAGAILVLSTVAAGALDPSAQLDRLVGTWDSPGTFVDSAYSKAGTAHATTTCAWSQDRVRSTPTIPPRRSIGSITSG